MKSGKLKGFVFGLCALVMIIPATSAFGAEESKDSGNFTTILKKIEVLEKRIDALEKKKTPGKIPEGEASELDLLKKDLEDLAERLDNTEKKTLMDKVNIGAELRTRVDWFDFEDKKNHVEEDIDALISTRFRLNLRANVTKNFRFHSRLVMYKNWDDDNVPSSNVLGDENSANIPTNSTLRVERAYIDYFFDNIPVALFMGRAPSTSGLPTEYREFSRRKSTYPALAYDMEAEGAALTLFLKDWVPLPNPSVRFVVSRWVDHSESEMFRTSVVDTDDVQIYVLQMETGLPGKLRDSLFIFNLFYVGDYPAADLQPMGYRPVYLPDSLGSIYKYTFLLENNNFLDSGIDWFAAYSHLETTTSGEPAKWDVGGGYIANFGLLSDDNSEKSADAFHVGLRAGIPVSFLKNPKIGIEYNHGSKYWAGFGGGSEDPLRKLNTRGDAWDFYYIQPISRFLFLRLGYTQIDYDYGFTATQGASLTGEPVKADERISNAYFLLDARF